MGGASRMDIILASLWVFGWNRMPKFWRTKRGLVVDLFFLISENVFPCNYLGVDH